MGLFSVAKMNKGEAKDAQEDHWSNEPLVRLEEDALRKEIADIYDRPYDQMLKDKKHLKLMLGIVGAAFVVSLGVNGYALTRPTTQMNWALADPISGEYHVVTKTTTDVPLVVMKEALPYVGDAAFAVSPSGPDQQRRADYRSLRFVADADQYWQAWSKRHPETGVFRTVATKHRRHSGGMEWTVEYHIEEFMGKSAIPARAYVMSCRVRFEFRTPAFGNILGEESGLRIPGLLCTEEPA